MEKILLFIIITVQTCSQKSEPIHIPTAKSSNMMFQILPYTKPIGYNGKWYWNNDTTKVVTFK